MTQVDHAPANASTQSQPAQPAVVAQVAANMFQLSGGGIHVAYLSASGVSHLSYQDAQRTLNFGADQIRVVEVPGLGKVVTVTLIPSVDAGSTTFSVLVPTVNLPNQPHASGYVRTEGITTVNHFSIVPILNMGQLQHYTVTPLHGTASLVIVNV